MNGPLVEVCVDDVAGAVTAEAAGADRIELCASLVEGGITPSFGMVERVLARVERVGVQVLIRPRPGDFVFDRDELEVMLADIAAIRGLAADVSVGFVVDALTAPDSVTVRLARCARSRMPSPRGSRFGSLAGTGVSARRSGRGCARCGSLSACSHTFTCRPRRGR